MWRQTRRCLAAPPSSADINAAFKILGLTYSPYVPQTMLHDQVRKNYRELARLHHPDLSSGDDNRMKVINTAYELIQSSGVLQGAPLDHGAAAPGAAPGAGTPNTEGGGGGEGGRFARKAGSRRHRMPDDFASGDDATASASWSMRSSLDWQSLMNSTETLTKEELSNPANHPFSHSRFFTFDEDVTIYRMIRGGATVPQVARTMGKPATFVEKRLHNAQFKLRVQYVLRGEKRGNEQAHSSRQGKPRHGGDQPGGPTPAAPSAPNAQERLLKRSPYEERDHHLQTRPHDDRRTGSGLPFGVAPPSRAHAQRGSKRREWEATMPAWEQPRYFADMSLEEKGRYANLIRDAPPRESAGGDAGRGSVEGDDDPVWGASAVDRSTQGLARPQVASKIGRSYANYARLRGGRGKGRRTRAASASPSSPPH